MEDEALRRRLILPQAQAVPQHRSEIERRVFDRQATAFDLGGIEDVVDQCAHGHAGPVDDGQSIAQIARDAAIRQHHLRHTQNAVQRRANFVAGRRKEFGLGGQRLFQVRVDGTHTIATPPQRDDADAEHQQHRQHADGEADEHGLLRADTRLFERDAPPGFVALQVGDSQFLVREIEARRHQRGIG